MRFGRVAWIAVLAVVAAAAYAIYSPGTADRLAPALGGLAHRFHGEIWTQSASGPGQAQSEASGQVQPVAAPITVSVTPVKRADFPIVLEGLGQVQAYNTVLVRARVDGADRQDRLQGRPDGQGGRSARPDRPAAVSGGARPGDGEESAGRGQSRQRQARSGPLRDARQAELRDAAATRHAELAGQSADGVDRGRRSGDRRGESAARLHDHSRADLRPRRIPADRRRQSRQRRHSRPGS